MSKPQTAVDEIGGLDRYDRRALTGLEYGQRLTIAQLHRQYKNAGVTSKPKIKYRMKRLSSLGLIEHDWPHWIITTGGGSDE